MSFSPQFDRLREGLRAAGMSVRFLDSVDNMHRMLIAGANSSTTAIVQDFGGGYALYLLAEGAKIDDDVKALGALVN